MRAQTSPRGGRVLCNDIECPESIFRCVFPGEAAGIFTYAYAYVARQGEKLYDGNKDRAGQLIRIKVSRVTIEESKSTKNILSRRNLESHKKRRRGTLEYANAASCWVHDFLVTVSEGGTVCRMEQATGRKLTVGSRS